MKNDFLAGQKCQSAKAADVPRMAIAKPAVTSPSSKANRAAEEFHEDMLKGSQEVHSERRQEVMALTTTLAPSLVAMIGQLQSAIYHWNDHQGFWESSNTGEKLALMHSELSEALEADRHGAPSDKIVGYTGVEEELADTLIRILDFAGKHDLRLAEAFVDKLQYNLMRPWRHGKAY